jgi:DNA-binding FrmR family transcriptional regulator
MNPQKEKTLIGFKKAHSLLQKIISMVEHDRYCIDIMQQNLAVIGLLKSAHQQLLDGHLNSCFKSAMETNSPAKKKEMIEEILTVTRMAGK